jgi:hypothetical protein
MSQAHAYRSAARVSGLLVFLLISGCGGKHSALLVGKDGGEFHDVAATGSGPDGADATGSTVDTSPACTSPLVGGACTSDDVACATCCTDRWTCLDGVWQRGFIGCLPVDFACGTQRCSEVGSYCEIATDSSGQTRYACKALPSACATARCPACACLTQAGISFTTCTTDAGGGIWAVK